MEVKNYIKCRKSSAIYSYYMYVDTWERKGDRIFDDYNLKLKGALRHIAFATDDVDGIVDKVKKAGYEVFIEPNDIVIKSEPEYPARMAFCFGPLGEEIEFFQER